MPKDYRHLFKTKPMKLEHFQPVIDQCQHWEKIGTDGWPEAKRVTRQKKSQIVATPRLARLFLTKKKSLPHSPEYRTIRSTEKTEYGD